MSVIAKRHPGEPLAHELPVRPREELIGPGSALYRIFGDFTSFVYASMPASTVGVLHPKGAQGLGEHDHWFGTDPAQLGIEDALRRVWETLELVAGVIYGGDEREYIAHAIRELHRPVRGTMPDGSRYHAWNADVWNYVWATTLKAVIDSYERMRGFRSRKELDDTYEGFREVGRMFGVRGLPDTWEELDEYCHDLYTNVVQDGRGARFWLAQLTAYGILKPRTARWIPRPVWRLVTLPVRRIFKLSLIITLPEEVDRRFGLRRTAFDRLELALHTAFWRLVPRRVTEGFAPTYFALRRRFGEPVWRRRWSPEVLAERHARDRAQRAGRAKAVA